MVKFLKFVSADLRECEEDFEDEFVKKLQKSVRSVKESREMEERFMLFEELLRDEHAEGKAEGKAEAVLELLYSLGTVPQELQEKIFAEKDGVKLLEWVMLAAKAESVEQFLKNM